MYSYFLSNKRQYTSNVTGWIMEHQQKVCIELPVTSRHRCNMTEILLKGLLKFKRNTYLYALVAERTNLQVELIRSLACRYNKNRSTPESRVKVGRP